MKTGTSVGKYMPKIIGVLIMVVAAIVLLANGMPEFNMQSRTANGTPVSVIVSDSANDRWTALRQGFEQAAKDYNMELNFVSTSLFQSAVEEKELIDREAENGAKGILYQASFGGTGALQGHEDLPIMLLGSDVEPEEIYPVAQMDNAQIGKILAQSVKDIKGNDLSKVRIGVLCGNQNVLANKQRLDSLIDSMGLAKANYIWIFSSEQTTVTDELRQRGEKQQNVDVLIALNNNETEHAIDYLLERKNTRTKIVGMGTSEKLIYYLDEGMIAKLVVPNDFQMGYQAMEQMANYLNGKSPRVESVVVGNLVVDKETLYDDENQKIIFPNVQ